MDKKDLSFIYTIAHELKTPVITIEGFLNAISKDFGSHIPSGALEYLNYIDNAVKRLKFIINDLLDLSKISKEQEEETQISLEEIINEVLIRMRPLIKEKRISVIVQKKLPLIYGKKKQIELALENLISNAIKYIGKKNPDPKIEIGANHIGDEKVFFIRDNGIGVENNYIDKIFQIFQRAPSARKESEGTGIGLFIVKNIIENHGGRIWVESTVGRGSTFYFSLPVKDDRGYGSS